MYSGEKCIHVYTSEKCIPIHTNWLLQYFLCYEIYYKYLVNRMLSAKCNDLRVWTIKEF